MGEAERPSTTVAGSTVLVTGASSGIGAALAPMLAERGATVGIVARRADRLAEVLGASAASTAPDSRMWVVDLADPDAAASAALEAGTTRSDASTCWSTTRPIPKRRFVQALDARRGRRDDARELHLAGRA